MIKCILFSGSDNDKIIDEIINTTIYTSKTTKYLGQIIDNNGME